LGKKVTIPKAEHEERGSSSAGLKIDAKAKIQIDREKKLQAENKKELEVKEEQKKDSVTDEKSERKENKAAAERDHRENYIQANKTESFLYNKSKKVAAQIQLPPNAPQTAENAAKKSFLDERANVEMSQQENILRADKSGQTVDLTNTYVSAQTGEISRHSAEFLKVKKWLGNSAAMSTVERQFLSKAAGKEDPAPADKDETVDFVNENWKPNSPKSRR
jgi:hypothetical protein